MVVLLVGIMAVVQMFPSGFRVVRAGESKSIAAKLARQEIERWKVLAANLPEAILPIAEDGVVWNNENPATPSLHNAYPGPPFTDWYQIKGGGFQRGNAFNHRQIIGETVVVPSPSFFSTGGGSEYGSRYVLAFSPIDARLNGNIYDGIAIKGADMRRNILSSGDSVSLKPGNFAVNEELSAPASGSNARSFQISVPRYSANSAIYYVSYSYWAENGGEPELFTVIDQQVSMGSWNLAWFDVPITPMSGYNVIGLNSGSESCARGFIQLGSTGFSTDPYEFKLADPIIGVISFNPNGNGAYEDTSFGRQLLQARIDYRIYDLRIIREDKVVPRPVSATSTIPMKMALRFILAIDDPTDNPNEELYKGLTTSLEGFPVYIIDLATGLQVSLPNFDPYNSGGTTPSGTIDYKTGVIYLPQRASLVDWQGTPVMKDIPLTGRHLRFHYRADGDWSVQCQKACTNFTRVYDLDNITYNTYVLKSPNQLNFADCMGGQTVSVDYSYVLTDDPNDTSEHRVPGVACQISDTSDPVTGRFYVDLKVPTGADYSTKPYKITRIAVTGISFRARVIWRDGGSWRHEDIDTSLMRQ